MQIFQKLGNKIRDSLSRLKAWTILKWTKFKKWLIVLVMPASAMGLVATNVVDDRINPYTETDTHYEMSVREQVPEQGEQRIKFAKNHPEMVMEKWNEEIAMKVRYDMLAQGNRPLFSKNVEWEKGDETVRGYKIDDENYEFEIELSKKPNKNKFDFIIEGAENLDFFYQPALTQEEIDEGSRRPDNVIGSYAVYHKTKANHRVGSINYATGKVFHIYRPKAIDADGKEEWAELSYATTTGILAVTVPQNFLDNAEYPVIVDPTFGHTGIGGSEEILITGDGAVNDREGTTASTT